MTEVKTEKLADYLSRGKWKAQPASGATFSVSMMAIASGAKRVYKDEAAKIFDDSKLELSLTLLMQPVAGGAYDLAKLPSEIAKLTGDIQIVLEADGASTLVAKLTVGNVGADDATVGDLWRRLMAPATGAGDWWTLLGGELPHATPDVDAPSKEIAPIVPVPRGEAAVSMVLRRAKRVKDRIDCKKSSFNPDVDLDRGNEGEMVVPHDGNRDITQAQLEQRALDTVRKAVAPVLESEVDRAEAMMGALVKFTKLDKAAKEAIEACRVASDGSQCPTVVAKAICDGDAPQCEIRNATHRSLHFAALDGGQQPAVLSLNTEDRAAVQRRLQAIECLPRLARLFNMVVDARVVIDTSELGDDWQHKFVSVAAKLPAADGADATRTRAKLSKFNADKGLDPQFWPCTQEEVDASLLEDGCGEVFRPFVSQRDGIVDLGVTTSHGANTNPRFDIVTVDTIAGIEEEMNQERARATRRENDPTSQGDNDGVVTLRSVGLCLVDRWSRDAAIKMALNAAALKTTGLSKGVLDADTVQIGWRLDVGTEGDGNKIVWRSLCNRFVDYHDPAAVLGSTPGAPCGSWIEKTLLERFSPEEREQRRYDLDAAYIASPLRSAQHTLGSGDSSKVRDVLHADDIVAQWEGDPLGVECDRHVAFSYPKQDFAITQVHKLAMRDRTPGADPKHLAYLPPPLRFGQRYRLAARAVYRGGVVQPLKEAEKIYGTLLDGTAVLPPAGRLGRTFRRHERIGAITVTHSRDHIEQRNKTYPLAQSRCIVLREGDAAKEFQRRVLVPPFVGQAFAALHGVFDDPKSDVVHNDKESRPRDGLRDVNFTAEPLGGFPVVEGSSDVVFDVVPGGGGNALKRKVPYYPDPAARFMVLRALRTQDMKPFKGAPIVVKLYSAGIKYPDVLPVVLDVVRVAKDPRPASDNREQANVLKLDETVGGLADKERYNAKLAKGMVPVRRVVLELLPGDDVTIECWCIPDLSRLQHWFDVVESMALLEAVKDLNDANAPFECIQPLPAACAPGGEADADSGATKVVACGVGGLKIPDGTSIESRAKDLDKALRDRPVPEISSVDRIQAVYAISKPRFDPVLPLAGSAGALTFVRRRANDIEALRDFVAKTPRNTWRSAADEDDATEVLFGGTVKIDVDTSDALLLTGAFASPETDRLDDPRRGFSSAQLSAYLKEQAAPLAKPDAGVRPYDLSQNGEFFGFKVAKDGTVSFERSEVPLLTFRNLVPAARDAYESVEEVDLTADLAIDGEPPKTIEETCPKTPPTLPVSKPVAWRYKFKDTLARNLDVSLRSTARFDDLFVKADLSGDRARKAKDTANIWINSTRRPSRIEPKSLLPAFVWTYQGTGADRRTVVRVRFKRPWFSSGEGERLGVVIWPVTLFEEASGDIARRKDYSDTELGPGGGYITRWGADPIRKGATPDGWIVPREVFADQNEDNIEKNVLMPLPANTATLSAEVVKQVSLPGDPPNTMRVSLLTYEPKFDPVQALWYVDMALDALDLPDPFLRLGLVRYQKHAAAPLQVSEPVVEWVQLLPRRSVRWKYIDPTPGAPDVRLAIEVTGPGSLRAGREIDGRKDADKLDRPVMKAEVSVRRPLGKSSLFQERPLLNEKKEHIRVEDIQPRRTAGGLTWTLTLRFPASDDPRKKDPAVAYHVYIEEVVRMLSASGTPESPLTQDGLVDTGPRFAFRIDL